MMESQFVCFFLVGVGVEFFSMLPAWMLQKCWNYIFHQLNILFIEYVMYSASEQISYKNNSSELLEEKLQEMPL